MTGTGSWSGRRRSFSKRQARLILQRDKVCQLEYPGCLEIPTEADHIIGHADALAAGWDPEDIDDITNGQAVCAPCHKIKTRQEQTRGQTRARTRRQPHRPKPKHPGITE